MAVILLTPLVTDAVADDPVVDIVETPCRTEDAALEVALCDEPDTEDPELADLEARAAHAAELAATFPTLLPRLATMA